MASAAAPLAGPASTRARPSLRRQLRLGFIAVAAALALVSLGAVASLDRLGGAIATILRENYATVILCEQMKEALERQDSAMLFAATGRPDIAAPLLAQNRARFMEALVAEEHNITVAGEGELVSEIRARYEAYVQQVDHTLALPAGAQQEVYFRELLPRFTTLKDRVQQVLRLNQATMEDADRRATQLARRMVNTALLVCLVTLALAIWLALRLPHAIARPLQTLTRSATAIGDGDFDVVVEEPETEELFLVARAFNVMSERLRAYRNSSLGELLAAKDLARSTIEGMLDPVVVLDGEGGVHLANEAAERELGLRIGSADELGDAGIAVPEELTVACAQALRTGAPVLPQSLSEAIPRRVRGGDRYYLVRALPLGSSPKGQPSALIVTQDVTRLRRIDELKSDMVATVSHQFKTPLTSLRMATHLLLERSTGPLNDAQRELVTTARDDCERLRSMVEELLDVVRIETDAGALHRVLVEPAGLLHEVADAHRAIARDKGVALEVEIAERGPALVDPERLSIALANLVSNAIRHTPSGGRVILRASRGGGALRIEIADTGEGISPASLPHIFDRAFTTGADDAEVRRHGLGLTIAREIVIQHGGELSVRSEPERGSVFTVEVPLDPARA